MIRSLIGCAGVVGTHFHNFCTRWPNIIQRLPRAHVAASPITLNIPTATSRSLHSDAPEEWGQTLDILALKLVERRHFRLLR